MNNRILMEINDQIATIMINRPEALNALSKDIVDEMDKMIEVIKANKDVRVLMFYSKENFAAGADIKVMATCNSEQARDFVFTDTYNKIHGLEIPTIAAIDGYALGGGLELALTCDFRIVSKSAKMGLPELNLGIIPGAGGTVRLARIVGESKAKEMIFLSKVVDGEYAEKIGLANLSVEKEELLETALAFAEKLKRKSSISFAAAKKSIENGICDTDYRTSTKREAEIWSGLFDTFDQKEGMTAFFEKRKPNFKGE
jgi:enoyl-CoA hydratase/carnithine racemase